MTLEAKDAGSFCVLCGRQGVELFDALCASCLTKKGSLVTIPQRTEVTLCPMCGARQLGKHWERGPPPGLFRSQDLDVHVVAHPPAKLESIRWEEGRDKPTSGPGVRTFNGVVSLKVGATDLNARLTTELREIHHVCPRCSRREGSYYTANIQFRPALRSPFKRPLPDFKRSTHHFWEGFLSEAPRTWREALAWEEELKEGWDVYLMDTAVAKAMAKALKKNTGATTKESATLWGMKEGRRTYRVTILLRFPPIMLGDFFEGQGDLVKVIGQDEDTLRVVRSKGLGIDTLTQASLLEQYRFVGGPERIVMATPDPKAPNRVIDPGTGESLRLEGPLPPDLPAGADIRILLDGERAWQVPERLLRPRSR